MPLIDPKDKKVAFETWLHLEETLSSQEKAAIEECAKYFKGIPAAGITDTSDRDASYILAFFISLTQEKLGRKPTEDEVRRHAPEIIKEQGLKQSIIEILKIAIILSPF